MNIDMTQERDGGRVSSPALQQPDKLRRGGVGVGGVGVQLCVRGTLGFKIQPECLDECAKQALSIRHIRDAVGVVAATFTYIP